MLDGLELKSEYTILLATAKVLNEPNVMNYFNLSRNRQPAHCTTNPQFGFLSRRSGR